MLKVHHLTGHDPFGHPTEEPVKAKIRGAEGVREGRLELPRPLGHRILSPARLPVPPLSRGVFLQVSGTLRRGDGAATHPRATRVLPNSCQQPPTRQGCPSAARRYAGQGANSRQEPTRPEKVRRILSPVVCHFRHSRSARSLGRRGRPPVSTARSQQLP